MPGYEEQDEIEYGVDCDEDDGDEVIDITDLRKQNTYQKPVSGAHRPPNSAGNAAASSSKIQPPVKPRRNSIAGDLLVKSEGMKPAVVEHAEVHQCPVCGKTLETDNQGLNTHVDFCLSRGAILEAQVAASHAPAAPKKFTGWPKPESIKKDEAQKAARNKGKPISKRGK